MARLDHAHKMRPDRQRDVGPDDLSIQQIASVVSDTARSVARKLGKGLPKSIYQMTLLKQLAQIGFSLEHEHSSLGSRRDRARDIIIINHALVIECIVEAALRPEMLKVYTSRLMFDVETSGYDMGLVINFGVHANERQVH